MAVSRRTFLRSSVYSGAGLVLIRAADPMQLLAAVKNPELAPYLTGQRMAATPATDYRPYRSKTVTDPSLATWVQIDLGSRFAIDAVELYPASQRMYPGRDQYYGGEGFPLRFKIEGSDDPEFANPRMIADFTKADFPDPQDNITRYDGRRMRARYVRITATRLRPVKVEPKDSTPTGRIPIDGLNFTLTLAKVAVVSGEKDVAVGCKSSGDPMYSSAGDLGQLTRPARQDGEQIRWDNPENVTDPSSWTPVKYRAQAPVTGVTIGDGVFRAAMENNIQYLLNSYTADDLLRQFYERTGKIKNYKATGSAIFWEEDLAGSNAGRFLMGAGNTVRWIKNPELERRIEVVVDGIDACKEPNGYMMAYPADTIFYSERGAYTRAWLTHGLLEAGYAGNEKAFPLLRGYYDWFNKQEQYLPELLRGAVQGGQGMIANTRVSLSPVGKHADVQVIQRYFEEPAFLAGTAAKEDKQIWQYPYDRPHCYLLTNLEAYLDMYLATGDRRYHDAVLGAWEMYHQSWEQPGGSISIIEFRRDPPGSNYLHEELGELCGSSFWVFLSQRFHLLNPEEERYVTEIEKSIYNVAIANQDGSYGLRYHTHLEGTKEQATRQNTCCEGQGTRLLGSLPEHIYSVADDGVYLNLYEPSTISWKQGATTLKLTQKTKFPLQTAVRCTLEMSSPTRSIIRVRVPSWASRAMEVSVNGRSAGTGKPGSYLALDRTWTDGDAIEFTLPARFRFTKYTGADQIPGTTRYAVEYGPMLYAAVGSPKIRLSGFGSSEELENALQPIDGKPLHYSLRGNDNVILMPYWQVSHEEFSCFPIVRQERS
ncbi:DUF1680 family protein [Acidipila rosea]|uniref:DUF1680 family protein n=2 Tax=Acidipila rosea TaxID=768535 RepID=A0A4R1L5R0_9BACT|nr:DUF1680 family protein [Acidipila rosea]